MSGENRVVDNEVRLLRDHGHDVELWDPAPDTSTGAARLTAGANAVWSAAAARDLRNRISAHGAEVVHCHNLYPALSPSVLRAGASAGAAVVVTLHNYRLMCLPATFLRDGRTCEDCLGRLPWPGVVHRCYRGSLPGSAALAASHAVHRAAGTFGRVQLYLPVSAFVRDKHVQAGFPPDRMRVKGNFTWPVPRRRGPGDHFLFLGRLTPEKGVDTLLDAWRDVAAPLKVAGDGPDAERLRASAPASVELIGAVPASAVPSLLAGARAVVLPSRWYEGAPMVIAEAYAAGVPVVAADVGGVGESVEDGRSGILVSGDGPGPWADAATRLLDDGESERLGEGAIGRWRARHSPEAGIRDLEAAYREAVAATVGGDRLPS